MRSWRSVVGDLKLDAAANLRSPSWKGIITGYFVTPGVYVMVVHRLAEYSAPRGALGNLISRLLWMRLSHRTGCHFASKVTIAGGLALPHPTGIVLGDGAIIEPHVTIFQNVTIGQKAGRYPTICSGTIINAGAVVAGGVRLERDAVVGSLAFVNKDVSAGTTVVGSPARPLNKPTAR